MIRINLAPETQSNSLEGTFLRDALVLTTLCAGVFFGTEYYAKDYDTQIEQIEARIAEKQKAKEGLKKDIERAKEIKLKTEQIGARSEEIRKLGEGRKLSIVLLDNLQIKHPERMWFSKIELTRGRENAQALVMTGYALDHTVIADYMKRLKEIGKMDSSDASELKEFIPPQLINSELKQETTTLESKPDVRKIDQVMLKSLVSEEKQGVTLQKFEITIYLQNG